MKRRKIIIAALLVALFLCGCRSDTIYVQIGNGGTNPPQTTAAPAPETTEIPGSTGEPQGELVWIPTNGGTKYHKESTCSSMQDPKQVTMEEAEKQGFTACKRCYK